MWSQKRADCSPGQFRLQSVTTMDSRFTPNAARAKVQPQNHAGCRDPGCSLRRGSRPYAGGVWCGSVIASCSAPWRRCSRGSQHLVGRSTRPSSNASTSASVSMWPPWGVESTPCVNMKRGDASNWGCIRSITMSCCLTRADVNRCSSLSPRTGRARPSAGSRERPPWPLD